MTANKRKTSQVNRYWNKLKKIKETKLRIKDLTKFKWFILVIFDYFLYKEQRSYLGFVNSQLVAL